MQMITPLLTILQPGMKKSTFLSPPLSMFPCQLFSAEEPRYVLRGKALQEGKGRKEYDILA